MRVEPGGLRRELPVLPDGQEQAEPNLSQGEILGQVRDIKKDLPQPEELTNLVFMGMGEPLANFDHLMGALAIITDSDIGLGFAAKRVTVSTAGLAPEMFEFGRQSRVSLAVSPTLRTTKAQPADADQSHLPAGDAARGLPQLPASPAGASPSNTS